MSGHSKWSQIRHKKAITDAKKGQLFSKMVREIAVAARSGGTEPENNLRLKTALERARALGLPKENVERALASTSGNDAGAALQEFLYEAVAPGGIYVLLEGITDNKNRTLSEIKQILTRHVAKLVAPGSLLWNFKKTWTARGNEYVARAQIDVSPEDRQKLIPLWDELADQNDIKEVYTNLANGL